MVTKLNKSKKPAASARKGTKTKTSKQISAHAAKVSNAKSAGTPKRQFSSKAWLTKKIVEIGAKHPEKTIAIVAHQNEVKAGEIDGILPEGLSKSKEFRQDLNMSGAYWFYNPNRMVLIQKSADKADAKVEDIRKSFRKLGTIACAALQQKKASDVEFLVTAKVAESKSIGVFENAFYLTNYENSHKRQPKDDPKKKVDEDADERTKRVNKKIDKYSITCEIPEQMQSYETKFQKVCAISTTVARDLTNTRGSVATPGWMEEQVHKLVKGYKNVKEVRVLNSDKLQKLGMNLFYNVGKGADSPPRCVMVHYVGNPSKKEVDIAFIGKGITYDTGGLNIKGTGFMEDMYGDKGGACAIIGALKGTLELGFKKNIVFACAFAENAIGSSVYKPSDIIKGMNGLSVEIGNTDAEGRLVLGDTFTYVQRNFKPKQIVDLATLTGACMVALGMDTAGCFSNNDALVGELQAASKESFEPIWHMPIQEEHKEVIKGEYGDIVNIGKYRFGGASQAAAFLLNFVENDTPWVHLDIAGPAMSKVAKPPVCSDQTGFGASLLLHFIKNKK